jgi:hypothetical protein
MMCRGLAISAIATAFAIAIALLPRVHEVSAQPTKGADGKEPACATIKSEEACRAREDCLWVPPMMTNVPRPAHCRAKPLGPPGIFTK